MDLVTLLRVALSLAVVFGLLWLSYRIAGKGARKTSKAAGAQLAVVARQGLTSKSAAVLLRAGDTQYLLGVTDSSVTVIDRHDAAPPFDDAVLEAQEWLARAGAAPEQGSDEPVEVPRDAGVLRTFLAPATWRRSAQTVWVGRR